MKFHPMTLTALAVTMLTAGPALAVQKAPAAQPERIENFTELPSFSAPGLVNELVRIGEMVDGRIAVRDPEGLIDRLQASDDSLAALAAQTGGQSGLSFEINFSTDEPGPAPCEDTSRVLVVTRQGTELPGMLCRIITEIDGVPVLMFDQVLNAPFDGQTLHIHIITSMIAERDSLREAGGDILSGMATDVLRSLILEAPVDAEIGWEQWRNLLDVLTERGDGFIRFDAPDTLAQRLDAASTGIQAEADIHGADWGFSFGVDGAQAEAESGSFDPERLAAAARPATAAWCLDEAPITVTGPAGMERTWHQCSGTPPGENPEILSFHKIWYEETASGAYHWLELTAVGSTDTPDQRSALAHLCQEALAILASGISVPPASSGDGTD
jgi:hypothetical protein